MKRNRFSKRENHEQINDDLGFDFQVVENKQYWIEDIGYEFSKTEIDQIEKATNELQEMCYNAIDYVILNNRFNDFNIPEQYIEYIKKSWKREDWSLYGRFDFFFDGQKLKIFEYNADTPTSLLEASLAQYHWMKGQSLPDQFNSIDEKMINWWKEYQLKFNPKKVMFTTVKENQEDFRNTEYIMDTAHRAGVNTDFIFLEDIGSDEEYLYDLENNQITHMFKLYPWEWIVNEEFGKFLLNDNVMIIEPIWKMLLSNKALMAILWELYPNSEYLLPTYFSPEKLNGSFVKKPILSREGQNVEIIQDNSINDKKDGVYSSDKNIYQEVCILPLIDGYYPVIGSWVVGEESAGIGIREDESKITANLSRFVPHYFKEDESELPKNKKGLFSKIFSL
jgi:glutathionylspermidine synthase